MTLDDFRDFLSKRGLDEQQITARLEVAAGFEEHLHRQHGKNSSQRPADKADLLAHSAEMIKQQINTWDNYFSLVLYGRCLGNQTLEAAALTLIDGAEAMDNLYHKLGEIVSDEQREAIFAQVEWPELGTDTDGWPRVTQTVIERVTDEIGEAKTIDLLADSLRYLADEWYLQAKAAYENCQTFEEFLEQKGARHIAELEKHRAAGTLYFTQPITQAVIDFVESQPEIRQGVRQGQILYETKIPYMAADYLAEQDPTQRRYLYCHCPWVRNSLLQENVNVPPTFCNCSAGYHKKYWEMVLGQPIKAEVLETVLQGADHCRFAIQLPENVLP